MKKVLLIEDRFKRQKLFINETKIDLTDYEDILDNFIDSAYDELVPQLLSDSFSFEKYDIVISHKSAFEKNNAALISLLKQHCHSHNIPLVLFSGGISNNYYDNSFGELLELNSKTFYSENLKLFLESYRRQEHNILMLCYGQKWETNVCCNVLEKLNLFLFENEDEFIEYSELLNATDLKLLDQVHYQFHHMNIENGCISAADAIELQTTIRYYFNNYALLGIERTESQSKNLLIHNNNVYSLADFDLRIKFQSPHDDIERYITESIIPELLEKDFEKIFIKDNLTTHYLELAGIYLAYHIRLSQELGDKRFVPIVILSDFDAQTLMRLDPIAQILLTKNIYLSQNNKEAADTYKSLQLPNLLSAEYTTQFLDLINVEQPKDYLSHHDISNEWSIFKWANALDVKSEAIDLNRSKIKNMLYFKYLQTLHSLDGLASQEVIITQGKGKILYIDDEWEKGWGDILNSMFSGNEKISFSTMDYQFQDADKFGIINAVKSMVEDEDPDVIILDLRLAKSDHKQTDIELFTGMKVLDAIHSINAGIQVIMLTATNKSTILEKLYEHKILGYIKKEHPDDFSVNTVENINKLVCLVERGLERKFLKTAYETMNKVLEILEKDIFAQYGIPLEKYEPFWKKIQVEVESIFDILDSNSEHKFLYAMVSISSSIEAILSIYIPNEREMKFWDEESYDCMHNALRCRIMTLFEKLGSQKNFDLKDLIDKRNDYMHKRPVDVHHTEITKWFEKFYDMVQIIENPPALRTFNRNDLSGNLESHFNNR